MNDIDDKTWPRPDDRPIGDLREWLETIEELGELVTVRDPVSRDEEMSAIGYLMAKQETQHERPLHVLRGAAKPSCTKRTVYIMPTGDYAIAW